MFLNAIGLSTSQMAFVAVATFLAYTVKGFSGFGAGLVAIPLLALVLPVQIAVPAVSLLSYGGNIMQSFALRKDVCWRDLLPMIPFSLLGVVIALWLLLNVDANALALALGIFVLFYSAYSLLPTRDISGSRFWAAPIGCLGGLIGALFGSGGFIYVVYLKLRNLDKSQFRGSVAMTLFIDGTFRVGGYSSSGFYTQQTLTLSAALFPVLLLALLAGHYLQRGINRQCFNQLVSVLLMLSSALLIYKSLH